MGLRAHTRFKIDDEGLLIERPHAGIRLSPNEAAALLDALLRERGYEKQTVMPCYSFGAETEQIAGWMIPEDDSDPECETIYVPLQREEPE